MGERTITNYVPATVLEFISEKVIRAKNARRPLISELRLPMHSSMRVVTFFADVSGFTMLTESLSQTYNSPTCFKGTDLLAKNLNQYMSFIIKDLLKQGADIVKFAGDSIVAVFPIDIMRAEHKLKRVASKTNFFSGRKQTVINLECTDEQYICDTAIRFSLKLLEHPIIRGYNITNNNSKDGLMLKVKFGLGLGDIKICHIGGASDRVMSRRIEYVAVGQALEDAYACEMQCKPGDLVVSKTLWHTIQAMYKGQTLSGSLNNNAVYIPYKRTKIPVSMNEPTKDDIVYKIEANSLSDTELPPSDYFAHNFDIIPEEILWSYVPLTATPYLRTRSSENEKWVNEFRKVSTVFCQLGFRRDVGMSVAGLATMNEVFVAVQECVFTYEGQINKFLIDDKGNTLIIVFGLSPFTHEDDAARACICGVAILDVLREMQKAHNLKGMAVGISTGVVYCGLFGEAARKEYTVLGDSVNIAARLMSQVKVDRLGSAKADQMPLQSVISKKPSRLNAKSKWLLTESRSRGASYSDLPVTPVTTSDITLSGPMYVDHATRESIISAQIYIQFRERSEPAKLKGKATPLRIYYYEPMQTTLAKYGILKDKIFTIFHKETSTSFVNASKELTFKDMLAQNQSARRLNGDEYVLWLKQFDFDKSDRGQVVHPDEKLTQLCIEAKSDTILHFKILDPNNLADVKEIKLLEKAGVLGGPPMLISTFHDRYELPPIPKPFDWPEALYHVPLSADQKATYRLSDSQITSLSATLQATGMSEAVEGKLENSLGLWYDCQDSISVIDELKKLEETVESGFQIGIIEGSYGVGKSFAVNHIFGNDNGRNLNNGVVTINVKADVYKQSNSAFNELVQVFNKLLILIAIKRKMPFDGSADTTGLRDNQKQLILEDTFHAGLKYYGKLLDHERDNGDLEHFKPQPEKLFLLNALWDTKFFKDINERRLTLEPSEMDPADSDPLVASRKDMLNIFAHDTLLDSVRSLATGGVGPVTTYGNQKLAVQSISSILCTLLAGFVESLGPMVIVIDNAQIMDPFCWITLLELCKVWNKLQVTFILPMRLVETIDNAVHDAAFVGNSADGVSKFPVPSEQLTSRLVHSVSSSIDTTADKKLREVKETLRPARTRFSVSRLSVRQMLPRSVGSGAEIPGLPYPLASIILDTHCLLQRMRSFTFVRLIEVRARKEYTEQIIRNNLEVESDSSQASVPLKLVELLEDRTNGNPSFIIETLAFLRDKGVLTKNPDLVFDYDRFKREFIEHMPPRVESFCCMIIDQLDLHSQLILKIAAYIASDRVNHPVTQRVVAFTFDEIISLYPLGRDQVWIGRAQLAPMSKAAMQEVEDSWNNLVGSALISRLSSSKNKTMIFGSKNLPYRFSSDWMRICCLRKITMEQESYLKPNVTRIKANNSAATLEL